MRPLPWLAGAALVLGLGALGLREGPRTSGGPPGVAAAAAPAPAPRVELLDPRRLPEPPVPAEEPPPSRRESVHAPEPPREAAPAVELQGLLVDEWGRPVPDVGVTFDPDPRAGRIELPDGSVVTFGNSRPAAQTWTDAAGRFSLPGVEPQAGGFLLFAAELYNGPPPSAPLDPEAELQVLVLPRPEGPRVEIALVDEADRAVFPLRFQVTPHGSVRSPLRKTLTASEAILTPGGVIFPHLPVGSWRLLVESEEHGASFDFQVPEEGELHGFRVTLRKGQRVLAEPRSRTLEPFPGN